ATLEPAPGKVTDPLSIDVTVLLCQQPAMWQRQEPDTYYHLSGLPMQETRRRFAGGSRASPGADGAAPAAYAPLIHQRTRFLPRPAVSTDDDKPSRKKRADLIALVTRAVNTRLIRLVLEVLPDVARKRPARLSPGPHASVEAAR